MRRFVYCDFNHDYNYACTSNGEVTWLSITAPDFNRPELAPAGQHLLMLTTLLPYQRRVVAAGEAGYMATMLKIAGAIFPAGKSYSVIEGDHRLPCLVIPKIIKVRPMAGMFTVSGRPARIQNQSPVKGCICSHWSSPVVHLRRYCFRRADAQRCWYQQADRVLAVYTDINQTDKYQD